MYLGLWWLHFAVNLQSMCVLKRGGDHTDRGSMAFHNTSSNDWGPNQSILCVSRVLLTWNIKLCPIQWLFDGGCHDIIWKWLVLAQMNGRDFDIKIQTNLFFCPFFVWFVKYGHNVTIDMTNSCFSLTLKCPVHDEHIHSVSASPEYYPIRLAANLSWF